MEYDFAPALAFVRNQLAPYYAYREALAAGVKVATYAEAMKWKEGQEKVSLAKVPRKKNRAAMTAGNKRKK